MQMVPFDTVDHNSNFSLRALWVSEILLYSGLILACLIDAYQSVWALVNQYLFPSFMESLRNHFMNPFYSFYSLFLLV